MLTWHIKPGNTSIINSIPERFVITELISERQRIITIHDSLHNVTTQCFSVMDAMFLAEATAKSNPA